MRMVKCSSWLMFLPFSESNLLFSSWQQEWRWDNEQKSGLDQFDPKTHLILPGLLYASRNYWNLDDLKSARRLCVISSPSIKRVNPPQSMSTSISSAIKQYLYPSQKSHISCPLNPHQRRKIETLVSFTPAALRGKAVGLKLLGKFQQNSDESLKRKQCCHVLRAGRFLFWMNKQCLSTLGFKEP